MKKILYDRDRDDSYLIGNTFGMKYFKGFYLLFIDPYNKEYKIKGGMNTFCKKYKVPISNIYGKLINGNKDKIKTRNNWIIEKITLS